MPFLAWLATVFEQLAYNIVKGVVSGDIHTTAQVVQDAEPDKTEDDEINREIQQSIADGNTPAN